MNTVKRLQWSGILGLSWPKIAILEHIKKMINGIFNMILSLRKHVGQVSEGSNDFD